MSSVPASSTVPSPRSSRVPVIGLVGGIGAGKSAVARTLESLGCVVMDSDAQAKALLDDAGVRDTLVSWWGARVLKSEEAGGEGKASGGRIDRAAVAGIIFGAPAERRRLEMLIHPMLHAERRRRIQEIEAARSAPFLDSPTSSPTTSATSSTASPAASFPTTAPAAIVIDAPLLFEAGVDRECDAVIFVEAPFEARLKRVCESRGWDEAELRRREASQLPLEEKRRRARHVVENTGSLDDLGAQVGRVLRQIISDHTGS